jgi:heme oxygenase (mycobilin-producing)
MIVAVSRFKASGPQVEELEKLFKCRARRVDGHRGFLGLEVLRSMGHAPTFMLITRWTDRDSLRAYMHSEDFAAVHRGRSEAAAEFSICEIVTT